MSERTRKRDAGEPMSPLETFKRRQVLLVSFDM